MDALAEEFRRSAPATCEEMTELEEPGVSDEVEDLRNSLREAVHDEGVQPKMQCLMMDPSFSMVTVQGEDSGIEWETTGASRSVTPWTAEPEFTPVRAVTPGSGLAGKIIFVMDEEEILKRRKTTEKASSPKKEVVLDNEDGVSGRPELVEVSMPNVKLEGGREQDEAADHQRLFRLVSEGSEILNIMVPPEPNLASVDEEESTAMVDNLSYLEETPATKTNDLYDDVFEPVNEVAPVAQPVTPLRAGSVMGMRGGMMVQNTMDAPGAPVSRPAPPGRQAVGTVDYFEKFTLIDGQAPGSPAVVTEGALEHQSPLEAMDSQGSEETDLRKDSNTPQKWAAEAGASEPLPADDLTSDHLDDVFYGGTDVIPSPLDKEDEGKRRPPRLSLKSTGSALFSSQEDILTPIFLPEGPPKIIDQILLEEPKAMAFMYSDLYEEATGSRNKDEDAESLSSEKSFHSRHSDREARGYLEMYVLKDETFAPEDEDVPTVNTKAVAQDNSKEERVRMLSQDSYNLDETSDTLHTEDELTDFLRASDNSSPCDIDPFPQLRQDENEATPTTKSKPKRKAKATTQKPPQIPTDQPVEDKPAAVQTDLEVFYLDDEKKPDKVPIVDAFALSAPKPVAPLRKKADSAPKTTLDLTPLMPVEVLEEAEAVGSKEQREEEKEMASPVETADEGDDGEDLKQQDSSSIPQAEDAPPVLSTEASAEDADSDAQALEQKDSEAMADTESAKELIGHDVASITAVDSAQTRVEEAERPDETEAEVSTEEGRHFSPPAAVTEAAPQARRCVIL